MGWKRLRSTDVSEKNSVGDKATTQVAVSVGVEKIDRKIKVI